MHNILQLYFSFSSSSFCTFSLDWAIVALFLATSSSSLANATPNRPGSFS